jgi:hypothetical protein
MVDLTKLPPLTDALTLDGYAASIAHTLFKGDLRDTGLPYTEEHLNKVALLYAKLILPDSGFLEAGKAAAWLHDGPEDKDGFAVRNPFNREEVRGRGTPEVYLNDLLISAGESGNTAAYMVFLMTHQPDRSYPDYFMGIADGVEKSNPFWRHHIAACVLKMADRRCNLNPDETRNINAMVKLYYGLEHAGPQDLEVFYRKTKTIDAFTRKGSLDFDVGLFAETLRASFNAKQKGVADDNLLLYLPIIEQRMLQRFGPDNGIFHWQRLRGMLKSMYEDSMELTNKDVYEIKRTGFHRGWKPPKEYKPILKEIRNARKAEKLIR